MESKIPFEIQRALECGICFEEYRKDLMPCTLPCGHSICFACVFKLQKDSKISCPMDKRSMQIESVSGNKALMNLIGALKSFYENKAWVPITKAQFSFTKRCNKFSQHQTCRFGDKCRYLHIIEDPSSDSMSGSFLYGDSSSDYLDSAYDDHYESEPSSDIYNEERNSIYDSDSNYSDNSYDRW